MNGAEKVLVKNIATQCSLKLRDETAARKGTLCSREMYSNLWMPRVLSLKHKNIVPYRLFFLLEGLVGNNISCSEETLT